MERMTGIDPLFVYSESRSAHMDVAHIAIFDPASSREPLDFERFRDHLTQRLAILPPLRRRLLHTPLGLDHPRWVDDDRFSLEDHLFRAALPAPGNDRALAGYASQVASRALDLSRAPWEMHFVEGLENGLVAVIAKLHHAAIDGISGIELIGRLLDLTPEGEAHPRQMWEVEAHPSRAQLLTSSLSALLRQPVNAARAVQTIGKGVFGLFSHAVASGLHAVTLPFGAPASPLSQRISPRRTVAFTNLSLGEVRVVKDAFGVTVNDVVLALCGGALRAYLLERGYDQDRSVVAVVPVSVRDESERDDFGNRLSAMFVPLASDVADPLERLRTIARTTQLAKAQDKAVDCGKIAASAAAVAPPIVGVPTVRLATAMGAVPHLRPGNAVVSNIGGSPVPLYCAGAELLAAYPFGPIVDGMALNITVETYLDSLCFGLNACPRAVPGLELLAHQLEDSLHDLTKAVAA